MPSPDICPQSRREDGGHAWAFDGDDPYIECAFCDQCRDAINGRVIRVGRPAQADAATAPDTPMDPFEAADDIHRRWE